jgi:hypothetical protein
MQCRHRLSPPNTEQPQLPTRQDKMKFSFAVAIVAAIAVATNAPLNASGT